MGLFRDFVSTGIDFVREEVIPVKYELQKAGILTPEQSAYEQKASLADPYSFGTMNYGYKERYSLLDYNKLRYISYADSILSATIQTRINQVAACSVPQIDKYKLGCKISIRDKERDPTSAEKKKSQEIMQFIQNTGVPENFEDTPERRKRDNFEQFLRKITRDSLTFDQCNFEITPRMNGKPYSFNAVDAATIRLIHDEKERADMSGYKNSGMFNDPRDMIHPQFSSGFKEFKPKHPRYCQILHQTPKHLFDEWEMAFGIRNPRTDILSHGYGYSEIEMLMTIITSHINAEAYNRRFFSQGSTVKGIITFEGNVPPDQLEAFRRQWYMQTVGVTNAWKTPIMSLGKENKLAWQDLHKTNREMEYGKWMEYCIKAICGVFQIDPIEIGFDISRQGSSQQSSTGGLGQGNQQERILYSQDKGLRPLLHFIQTLINDYVVYRIDPDFELEFVGLNVTSEKDELDRQEKQVKNFKTVNEVRAEHDLKPIPSFDKIESLGDIILDSSWVQQFGQQKQQDQMNEMGGDMGQPGMPDGQEPPPGGMHEQEPDYDNMSDEDLQSELDRLKGPEAGGPAGKGAPGGKPSGGAQEKKVKKSMEIRF